MNRADPDFRFNSRFPALSEEEANSFLDELFVNLFDQEDVSSDTDKVPDLRSLNTTPKQQQKQ